MEKISVQFDFENKRYLGTLSAAGEGGNRWNITVGQHHAGELARTASGWRLLSPKDYPHELANRFGKAIEKAQAASAASRLASLKMQRTPVVGSNNDCDFFTATFVHNRLHYRAAVAQEIDLQAPENMGNYYVLLQCNESTLSLRMWQGDNDAWQTNRLTVPSAIVNLLGFAITKSWNEG